MSINGSNVSNRCSYSKENLWVRDDYTDNINQRNETYHENS